NLYLQAVLLPIWGGLFLLRLQDAPLETSLRTALVVPATLLAGSATLYALMVAQSFLETDPVRSARSTLFSFGVPLVSAVYLASHFWRDLLVDPDGLRSLIPGGEDVSWWGIEIAGPEFQLASVCMFLPWAMFGLWRALRRDLQEADFPWAWPVFLLFLGVYVQGFAGWPGDSSKAVAPVGLIPLALLGWGFLLTENLDPMGLRRLLDASGSWLERLRSGLPLSWLTLATLAVLGLFACGGYMLSGSRGASEIAVFLAGSSLLALRDLALFSWISCRVAVGRQGLSRMALAVGVHVFLPVMLLLVVGDTRLVWPSTLDPEALNGSSKILLNLGSLGLQAVLAWAILVPASWKRVREA
ncbi:MAG TPA: hypothetical protein PKY05_09660, partial [Fibrobacteria bacterium]|nr:hypothetical protein [Fibrobacteria bacterium]